MDIECRDPSGLRFVHAEEEESENRIPRHRDTISTLRLTRDPVGGGCDGADGGFASSSFRILVVSAIPLLLGRTLAPYEKIISTRILMALELLS